MPQTPEQFAKSVVKAGLSSPDDLKTMWSALPTGARPKDGEAFARLLVEQGKLTEFQSEELLGSGQTPLVLGDYVLLSKIGAGGMGQVFKARHRHMKRMVAIKLLPNSLTQNAEAVARFQREVEAAAKLSHPNIVQAYDASMQRGVWYLVMEYVEGTDLWSLVKQEGPLTPEQAVICLTQAAQGLRYAHRQGVIHRDIKPANLLLDAQGTVKVLDMGLARLESAEPLQQHLTGSGLIMGTVDYMAPEQALSTRNADARSDIYSLGITLWYLLTGKPLYDGEAAVQKLMAHQQATIPPLTDACSSASPELQAVFARMAAKPPADRFQSMNELISAFAACPEGVGVRSEAAPSSIVGSATIVGGIKSTSSGLEQTLVAVAASPMQADTIGVTAADVGTDPQTQASLPAIATAIKPPIKTPVKTSAPRLGRTPRWAIGAALGGGGLLVLLAAVVYFFQTKDGVIRVEISDPGIEVAIKGTDIHLKQADNGKDVKVSPGDKTLVIERGDFKFESDKLVLKNKDTVTVRVALIAGNIEVKQGGKLIGQGKLPGEKPTPEPAAGEAVDRDVATWLHDRKVAMYLIVDEKLIKVLPENPLPEGPFTIKEIGNPDWTMTDSDASDRDLEKFTRLTAFHGGYLPLKSTHRWAALWAKMPTITTINAFQSEITDEDLAALARLPKLYYLSLHLCQNVTGKGIRALAGCPSLGSLNLDGEMLGKGAYTLADVQALQDALPSCRITQNNAEPIPGLKRPSPSSIAPPLAVAPFDADQARKHQTIWANYLKVPVEFENTLGMKFRLIPPGEFLMGADPGFDLATLSTIGDEKEVLPLVAKDVSPQHKVRLTRPFYLQVNEVNIGLYKRLMGKLPENNDETKPESPVKSNVTLREATAFCNALSEAESKTAAYQTVDGKLKWNADANGYRLPTEAEWEFACRAGTTTMWFFGNDPGRDGERTLKLQDYQSFFSGRDVKANPFGIIDLYGGAGEWCFDRRTPYRADDVTDPFTPPEDEVGVSRGGSGFAGGGKELSTNNSWARTPRPDVPFAPLWQGLGRVVLPIAPPKSASR
jgi:serine/threonine protein kinase/formylglycine-generating enzyme required for sulfatase activity